MQTPQLRKLRRGVRYWLWGRSHEDGNDL